MTNWKKTISAITSAALLASVFATSAVATKGTTGQSDQTDVLDCGAAVIATMATCSQVADGISTVTLIGDDDDGVAGGYTTYISASGATIIAAAGGFVLGGGIVTAPVNADLNDAADTITLRAPSAAGSATVSVYRISTTTGIASLEGTLAITFTASSGLDVSAANSVVKTLNSCAVASGAFTGTAVTIAPALPSNTFAAYLCVLVKDGNGSGVAGAVVSATITPVGVLDGDYVGQTTVATTNSSGVAVFDIYSTGLAGTATISTSATINSKTTGFTPVTFGFAGALASITATSQVLAVYWNGWSDHVVRFTGKDAAGNKVFFAGSDTFSSDTTVFTIDHVDSYNGGGGIYDGAVEITCHKVGSANVVVKQGSIASNAVKVYCSDWADDFTVAFDKTTVAPGGNAKLTVNVVDENGQPAASDGEDVHVIVSSGAITPASAEFDNGATVHTYLAPFNTGVATALVTVDGITGSKSASINIGAPAPIGIGGIASSALGVTRVGPFTAATKLPALGKYITVKMSLGTSAAGKTVEIWSASKNSAGVWSAFTKLTARVADASGNVYFFHRSYSAAWLSFYGAIDDAKTNSSQARWR